MPSSFDYDVFLSHNKLDRPRVSKLAERLKAAGLRVDIESGLESARVQVLCLSPAAISSDWVTLERSTVPFRDPANKDRRFVPLLLEECDLPDTLRRYKYVDFREEWKSAFDELLAACREEAEAPTPEPAEPLAVLERKLKGHNKVWVRSVAVCPDGTWAASGSSDNSV